MPAERLESVTFEGLDVDDEDEKRMNNKSEPAAAPWVPTFVTEKRFQHWASWKESSERSAPFPGQVLKRLKCSIWDSWFDGYDVSWMNVPELWCQRCAIRRSEY